MTTQLPQKKGTAPTQFLPHVYCGQTAEWIKMPVGTEVNLSPGDVVLDGVAAPPVRGAQPHPQFSVHVYCGQTAGWMKTPLCTEVDLGPGHIVLDKDPVPPRKGHNSPLFSAHVYCGHGRPSQILLSCCLRYSRRNVFGLGYVLVTSSSHRATLVCGFDFQHGCPVNAP